MEWDSVRQYLCCGYDVVGKKSTDRCDDLRGGSSLPAMMMGGARQPTPLEPRYIHTLVFCQYR